MKKLLLQACCGPCACHNGPFENYDVTVYFNGDNFNTLEEYDRRLAALMSVAEKLYNSKVITEEYNPKVFASCEECISYRLERCAAAAKGFDCFSTTLTVSPHKDSALVNKLGRAVSAAHGIPFVEFDLKKNNGFQKSVLVSKELGIYRQNYCGCAKSVRK